ncbi:MAG: hypothetical protein HQ518_23705 [Rhodopirellula sp.]|nr:hypothetical protein [Rhodopirellula sp.]
MRQSRIAIASACGVVALLSMQHVLVTDSAISHAKEPSSGQVDAAEQKPRQKVEQKTDRNVVGIPVDGVEPQKSILPYMHAKVGHSQRVFEGLVTKDFEKIALGAEALMLTSLSTPRVKPDQKRNDEVFDHLKLEFLRLAGQLQQMAADKNLEGAAYVTEKLNATCIACHQYLRDELPRIPTVIQRAK